jgi:hypothetical protein
MTLSTIPFALQNSAHSADLFRQATSSLVPPGGGIVTTGDFAVTQTGTPSMGVSVGVGRIWIPGTNVANVTGGNFSQQAMYYGQNNSPYTAAVTTSDSVNPRIDVVYAAVQDSQYAGTTNAGTIAVVAGVPTTGASYPANAPTIPANAIALAWINVPANASSIVNANITQLAGNNKLFSAVSGKGVTDGYWTITGGLVKTTTSGLTQVTATLQLVRTTAAITIATTDGALLVGLVPSGFIPTSNQYFIGTSNTDTGARYAEPQLVINTGGTLVGRSTSGGSITLGVGYTLCISTSWWI